MSNLGALVAGEVRRLIKYKIMIISLLVAVIWVIVIGLIDTASVLTFAPMLIMIDASMMTIIFLAASYYLEKQEGSIKSLLVSPVSMLEILLSKIIATLISSLISAGFVILGTLLFHDVTINIVMLLVYVALIAISHAAIGFVFIFHSPDFGALLGMFVGYMIVLFMPTILYMVKVIPDSFELWLIISPTHAAQILIDSAFNDYNLTAVILSSTYLVVVSVVLYRFFVYHQFKKAVIEG